MWCDTECNTVDNYVCEPLDYLLLLGPFIMVGSRSDERLRLGLPNPVHHSLVVLKD